MIHQRHTGRYLCGTHLIADLEQRVVETIASQRQIIPQIEDMARYRCVMFEETYQWLARYRVEPVGGELVIYYGAEFADTQIDMETAVPIPPDALDELMPYKHVDIHLRQMDETLPRATTIHKGSIYDLPMAITALFSWIHSSGYQVAGPIHELHLSGQETHDTDFNAILFEFQIPVTGALSTQMDTD